jgi:pSer/pThr/pTyr-binding forkhead associated (FHA) protein
LRITLEILSGPLDGEKFQFSKTGEIGRDDKCEVPIKVDKFISRHHARIMVVEPECFLEDLGSTNGTFIDDERLHKRVMLDNGHTFRVGKTWMQIDW